MGRYTVSSCKGTSLTITEFFLKTEKECIGLPNCLFFSNRITLSKVRFLLYSVSILDNWLKFVYYTYILTFYHSLLGYAPFLRILSNKGF